MNADDTIKLLKECDSGAKMAVSSVNDVIGKVKSQDLKNALADFRNGHAAIGNEAHGLLSSGHESAKDPSPTAKGMSRIKTNI